MHGRHEFPPDAGGAEAAAARTWSAAACCSPTRSAPAGSSPNRSRAKWRPSFPSSSWSASRPNDPLFTPAFGGYDLSVVSRRDPQRGRGRRPAADRKSAQGAPDLEGLKLGDRYAVIFSPYDMSCALEKHESLECDGYTREDAARIGLNVLLYSFTSSELDERFAATTWPADARCRNAMNRLALRRSRRRRSRRWMVLRARCLSPLAVRGRAMLSMQDSLHARSRRLRASWRGMSTTNGRLGIGTEATLQPTAYRPPLYPLVLSVCDYLPEPSAASDCCTCCWASARCGRVAPGRAVATCRRPRRCWRPPLVAIDPILVNQAVRLMNETLSAFLATWTLVALGAPGPCAVDSAAACWPARWAACACLCRPTFLVWLVLSRSACRFVLPTCARCAIGLTAVFAARGGRGCRALAAAQLGPVRRADRHHHARRLHAAVGQQSELLRILAHGAWGSVWDADSFHNEWGAEFRGSAAQSRARAGRHHRADPRALAYGHAWQNIRDEPAMFAYACLVRVGRLWGVLPHQLSLDESPTRRGLRYAVAIWYAAELCAGGAGAWFLGRKLLDVALGVGRCCWRFRSPRCIPFTGPTCGCAHRWWA